MNIKRTYIFKLLYVLFILFIIMLIHNNNTYPKNIEKYRLVNLCKTTVTVTAYNACPSQTDDTPTICAWGDKIHPGVIAVSRDLEKLGITRYKKIYIEGMGIKIVKDRMHYRKRNQIDIYMDSLKKAKEFGVQKLDIYWVDILLDNKKTNSLLLKNKLNILYSLISTNFK